MEQRELHILAPQGIEDLIQRCIERSLKSISTNKTKESPEDRLFTTEEAAKYLKLSTATIYSYTSRGTIPFIKKGGKKILFRKSALDKWLYE
jgi:excisionase family DNA binding protein